MLQRRNPAATFEKDPAASSTAPAPASTPAPAAPTPTQHPTGPTGDKIVDTPTTGPAPVQHTGTAESTGTAAVQSTAMVRREANAGTLSTRVVGGKMAMALDDLKDLFTVDYDTFERLKSGSGNIVDSQNNSLGSQIALRVLSWQDAWDISPGSQVPEAKKVVKYSDDGVRTKDTGELITEYLDRLRSGDVDGVKYPGAKIAPKKVIVGVLEGAEKPTNLLGKTVQVSLSTQSAKSFDRHRFDFTLQQQMGKRSTVDGADCVLINAEARSSNGNNYTLLLVTSDEDAVKALTATAA